MLSLSDRRKHRRHEVLVHRAGRWVIECLVDGEEAAIAIAEGLLKEDDGIAAVRVVRERRSKDGLFFGTTVFERRRSDRKGASPVTLSAAPDEDAWCETLEDFYGAVSRRAIGRLLRQFLDRLGITQTELLYNYRFARKLDEAGNLQGAALHRMAQHQAETRGAELRARRTALERFVREATSRAREALAIRRLPQLGEDGLGPFIERMAGYIPDEGERDYLIRHVLCRWLEGMQGHAAKFEAVLKLAEREVPPAARPVLDELLADLLGAAPVVQDLLGEHPHLAAALTTLSELATGRWEKGGGPAAARLARLLQEHALPETRVVLLDRLRRELAGERPLSRDDKWGQAVLLQKIIEQLTDERGLYIGGGAMVEAIARRQRRLDIVGGLEPMRFAAHAPLARLEALMQAERTALADRQKCALATYMIEILDSFDEDAAALVSLRARIEASELPEAAKQAVLDRMPQAMGT